MNDILSIVLGVTFDNGTRAKSVQKIVLKLV